jgi:predicted AlkP superfamily phosphohydrolase/phosphomutase
VNLSATRKPRILLIGLDAGDRELIEQWERDGLLPTIARMRKAGTWAQLHTTADTLHVSAWPSIFTGAAPDKHGLYHAYVMQAGAQSPVRPRPDLCPVPFLWQTLDEHGKRCIVIDAFLTCPLKTFRGVQIVDWGSWTWFWQQTILPAALGKEIESRFGAYPAEDHSKVGMTPPPDPEGFRKRLLAAVEKKAEVARWLMTSQDWDFFLVVFGESHPAGHYFWHFQDPSYIAHPQASPEELRNALRDVYVALDRAVGTLLDAADEDTLVCLVSGDGMGPNYSGSHILAPILERMRLLNAPAAEPSSGASAAGSRTGSRRSLLATARGLIPKSVRAAISRTLLPRSVNEKLSMHWKTAGIAWERTRAFVIENANEGFIRINLKGREPQGTVQPGPEYDSLCRVLSETAATLVNPANGRRAAHAVHRTDELYQGPCRAIMPDVIIAWDPEAHVTTDLSADSCGLVHCPHAGYEVTPYYTGNHRPNAFAAIMGPGVAAGEVLQGASILDLAPTFLARLGIAAPTHMDGKPLREITAASALDRAS